MQKETGVVSFLKEVLGKKDTSYIKKIQACIKNRQANLYKLSPKGSRTRQELNLLYRKEEYIRKAPELKGFSAQNLWRMKQFYKTYRNADEKLPPLVREISWSNNCSNRNIWGN